jgi:hypothetical protein
MSPETRTLSAELGADVTIAGERLAV